MGRGKCLADDLFRFAVFCFFVSANIKESCCGIVYTRVAIFRLRGSPRYVVWGSASRL